jgi:hypothetical protein
MRYSIIPLAIIATIGLAGPASALTCAEKVTALEAKLMGTTSTVQGGVQTPEQAEKVGDASADIPVTDSGAASGGTQTESMTEKAEPADEHIPNTGSTALATDPLSGLRSADDTGEGNVAVSPDEAAVRASIEQAKAALEAGNESECQTHADAALMEYGISG